MTDDAVQIPLSSTNYNNLQSNNETTQRKHFLTRKTVVERVNRVGAKVLGRKKALDNGRTAYRVSLQRLTLARQTQSPPLLLQSTRCNYTRSFFIIAILQFAIKQPKESTHQQQLISPTRFINRRYIRRSTDSTSTCKQSSSVRSDEL
jgi:hypothetical protein